MVSSEYGNECSASFQGILTEYRSSCQGEPCAAELTAATLLYHTGT